MVIIIIVIISLSEAFIIKFILIILNLQTNSIKSHLLLQNHFYP